MATFITSKAVGETINIYVQTSTGYWKYNHDGSDSSVLNQGDGYQTITVSNVNGEFTIISCDSDGTVNGNVTRLNLQSNQITSFDGTNLSGLNELYLSDNQLTSLDGFIFPTSLTYLYLDTNQLTSFDGTGLSDLTILDLSANQLTSFDVTGLSSLTNLALANNQLTSFDGTGLSSLTYLYLNGNPITPLANNQILHQLNQHNVQYGQFYSNGGRTSASNTDYDNLLNNLGWGFSGLDLVTVVTRLGVRRRSAPVLIGFVSTWDTSLGDGQPTITLPLTDTGELNITINWGDGNITPISSKNEAVHTYTTGGIYTITITGTINGWNFTYGIPDDCQKITSILQWGDLRLGNAGGYFNQCVNLTLSSVSDVLNLTGTTNLSNMFSVCTSLTTINRINEWNVSGVTNIDGMFDSATSFNGDISSWDVSSVQYMGGMFYNATSFNGDISSWDVSSVQYMGGMFYNATSFNGDISSWDVSNVLYMNGMFQGAISFNGNISSWNVSNVLYMNGMFAGATSFNQDISSWNVSAVTNMKGFMDGKTTADFSYYDNLLNTWSVLTLQPNVLLEMGTIEYTSAASTARQSIIDNYAWEIADGGQI